ncbi:sigma-E factor negative regulatory protein [Bisgaard Taxon 10/6]|uniref:Anti-sigma-E factor RseA n=1 Tax=Exercitatus varius TaxID=67857 RepID=A0AAW6QCU3_9PAST|nr:sigma-E factor negative regulatory protein [Exercitatus varius]MDG2914905.1 sigma-E factor negative regulatory protein [Exercitatus varius]MDG2916925.1 sigma-E factor negative regulatory protein [Exercitatus varius]MDG2950015.1 sigma-E factor negative regulatory protein [Exercitatus varius]MDG2952657.1 sigma-E factor negative regulatory protein [Exercitatus varius]
MQKELLSAYIDGENVSNELTAELCRDAELQKSWGSFHAIRSVMRDETTVFLGADFTAKMDALIDAEPAMVSQPTPEEAETLPFMQKIKAAFAPMMQVAVAAGVCLVAVLGVQSFNSSQADKTEDTPVLQTLPFNNSVRAVSYNAPEKDIVTSQQLEQKNKRIGALLQNYELQRRVNADGVNISQQQK